MEATVRWRQDDGAERSVPIGELTVAMLRSLVAWRVLRQHREQTHLSGLYWSSTMRAHVSYESRLELARLLLADHDPTVELIVSQPFLVEAVVDGKPRRHVPDFLLVGVDRIVTVVNVKPAHKLEDAKVAGALGWADEVFSTRGWRHEIWTGTDRTVLENVRFLSGYRRELVIDLDLIDPVLKAAPSCTTLGQLEARFPDGVARPVALHLAWHGRLRLDLSTPLSTQTRMAVAA